MSDTAIQDFLAQFDETKELISQWPDWMKDAARVATASFPKPTGGSQGEVIDVPVVIRNGESGE
jgi:hypothetical protein